MHEFLQPSFLPATVAPSQEKASSQQELSSADRQFWDTNKAALTAGSGAGLLPEKMLGF